MGNGAIYHSLFQSNNWNVSLSPWVCFVLLSLHILLFLLPSNYPYAFCTSWLVCQTIEEPWTTKSSKQYLLQPPCSSPAISQKTEVEVSQTGWYETSYPSSTSAASCSWKKKKKKKLFLLPPSLSNPLPHFFFFPTTALRKETQPEYRGRGNWQLILTSFAVGSIW